MKMNTKKILVEKVVFHQEKEYYPFLWKDIKHFDFQDEDEINMGYDEWDEERNVGDTYTIEVIRKVLESDEEYEKRIADFGKIQEQNALQQERTYLELKRKFTGELSEEELKRIKEIQHCTFF
jgi:hypothetical protein